MPRPRSTRALAALGVLAFSASPAAAQLIPRAEGGVVELVAAEDPPVGTLGVIAKGQTAWTERYYPQQAARLLETSLKRVRPGRPPVEAGSVLFGYRLRGGYAYCPRLDHRAARPNVQCFRDLDGDGTFDAGYVTELRGLDSQVLTAFIRDLQPIPKLRYETIPPDQSFAVAWRWIYDGQRDGKPAFRIAIDDEIAEGRKVCEPVEDGACAVMGRRLKIAPEADGAAMELLAGAQPDVHVSSKGGPNPPPRTRKP